MPVGELLLQQFDSPETCDAGVCFLHQSFQLYSPNFDLKIVRKHFIGGFLCVVSDLSGILWSLLIPEYSGIKRRGTPFSGLRIQAFPSLVYHYGEKYPLLSLIGVALCFVSLEF